MPGKEPWVSATPVLPRSAATGKQAGVRPSKAVTTAGASHVAGHGMDQSQQLGRLEGSGWLWVALVAATRS